jgi:catechol 2,3-dioxygenase-like lactoylglutathione lyase family enzyme
MILERCPVVAFVATTKPEQARAFYCYLLGLNLEEDGPFALVVKTVNATLRIQKVEAFTPHQFTVLGWRVDDIRSSMKQLREKGLKFERFDGMDQDEQGVWITPDGAAVCWFKDPDGNVLSLTQAA